MAIIVSKVSIDIKCLRRLKAKIMKKSILNFENFRVVSKEEQLKINGAGGCCNPNSPFGINFPEVCSMFPPCHLQ